MKSRFDQAIEIPDFLRLMTAITPSANYFMATYSLGENEKHAVNLLIAEAFLCGWVNKAPAVEE